MSSHDARDAVRLRHMLDASLDAMSFASGKTRADLDHDRMLTLALVKCIEIIGEAASHVTAETQDTHAELGLAREVDVIVLSCDVGVLKPDPAIFGIALGQLAVPLEDAVFVDDRSGNLDGARSIGIRTVLIARHSGTAPTADHPLISELADLSPLLEQPR